MKSRSKFKYHGPKLKIIKSSGDLEQFNKAKLQRSLERAGCRPKECRDITARVAEKIRHGSTTHDIFKQTEKILRQQSPIAATHYSLKKSLLELGPTGYEFEQFVAKYFVAIGFDTYVDVTLQGEYVRHEVDVVASKTNFQSYVECKFHNTIGRKNDIKIVLYVKARWDDLKNGPDGKYLKEFYVATNTVFTTDALQYAEGVGLKLLGVNAPADESFLDKIRKHRLYPITSLRRLKRIHCRELLRKNIILCTELLMEEDLLKSMGMKEEEIENLFKDIVKIINHKYYPEEN